MTIQTAYVYEDDEHGVFPLEAKPLDEVMLRVVGDNAILCYVTLDEDAPNPLTEYASYGMIYSSHRGCRDQHGPFQEALGLNCDWEPDLELIWETPAFEKALCDHLFAQQKKIRPNTVRVEMQHKPGYDTGTITCFYAKASRTYPFELTYFSDEILVDYRDQRSRITKAELTVLWRAGRKNGTIGNKWAVSLDVYQHSGTAYSVRGEGMQCPWDTARGGAIWVPDDDLVAEIESAEHPTIRAYELARSACETYTDWCNGYVYEVWTETFAKHNGEWVQTDYDICGGYYGYDYTQQVMKDAITEHVKEWSHVDRSSI